MPTNINEVLNRLKGVKQLSSGNGYIAYCPNHDDRNNRSLSLTEREGKLLLHCFCGCSFGDILSALNLAQPTTEPILEAIYDYTDTAHQLLYQVLRYYPKSFKQRRPTDNSSYEWNLKGIKRVLFQLPKVINAVTRGDIVYFCEGEKDCLNLGQWGITATSISGGSSSSWQPQYSEVLHSARVAIIPDNDSPGHKHAEKIAKNLYGWADIVKILELGSKDVTEWLKTHNPEELQIIWNNTKAYIPIGAVTREEFNNLKEHVSLIHERLLTHIAHSSRKSITYRY